MKEIPEKRPPFADRPDYYTYVAHGYDLIIDTYDEVEAQNSVGLRLRARMQEALARSFRSGDRVLEIGCGTGLEAIVLATRGVNVLATDPSEAMVRRVQEKAAQRHLDGLSARRLAGHEVHRLANEFGEASFDGAYSHAGALNMEPRLALAAQGVARLLRPSARFVCSVVNQASLFEVLFYPLVLRPRKAFRRLGNDIPIPITRHAAFRRYVVPTRFYSPTAFLRHFLDDFVLRRLMGLQILLPPWNLSEELDRVGPFVRAVEALEDRLADKAPFNAWGSLFLAELERV